jgi:hypothetical protein
VIFRQVHVAAAAQADHRVGPKRPRLADGVAGGPQRRLRFAARENLDGHATDTQGRVDRLDDARPQQDRIGNQKGPFDAQAHGGLAQVGDRVTAKDKLVGRVEPPNGAHESIP